MTVQDLAEVLFSLTDILPSAAYIITASGAVLAPDAVQLELLLADAGIRPGDVISVSDGPPHPAAAASRPQITVDDLAAALARLPTASAAASAATPEGVAYVDRVSRHYEAVLEYGDAKLRELALAVTPLSECRATCDAALAAGVLSCPDAALGKALLTWFKDTFFSWVNQPQCWSCGGETKGIGSATPTASEAMHRAGHVELYECVGCHAGIRFPRYNSVEKLLETRRGRCGEFAQAFTLICIAAGLTARMVYGTLQCVYFM
jgi:peptide-N4-(N-acetyl-beta-glucosaminyl)asparagine amidase